MMNRGNTNAARKVVRQDLDEESLVLFREMHKHEKDEVASLLLPVSEELESNGGGYGLYRVTSGRKNDYDWLKTPPATPLFPSLEMEANSPALLIQRELPIVQPLLPSRFSDNSKGTRTIPARSSSPSPKTTKISPANLAAPHRKSSTRSSVVPAALNLKLNKSNNGAVAGEKWNTTLSSSSVSSAKSGIVKNKESNLNLLASNLSKSLGPMDSSPGTNNKQPRSRGVSPLVRSKIPAQFPGFSDETPPNLRTDRSVSAARGRSDHQHKQQIQTIIPNQRPSSVSRTRRQSCSPSVGRGRKTPQVSEGNGNKEAKVTRIMQHGNPQVLGSRMVDKFLNARKASSIQEGINNDNKAGKLMNGSSINESSGFGRMMSRNSLNMALKHMEIKQIESNKNGMATARKSTSNMRGSSISSRPTSNGNTFL
ncbi:PREDICTED: mediator of DNA damage checkpoint protein 1-like isoform X2 [Ipomoea nil]|uniref:mediator of DNA damage checkpoint protein 1-like isoform X2 n=1 Tax=Ipomoea nil TaxID=35883 RepID=UPI0009011F4E|nr:PREDICTED: mediator of DNA damage checkpoint protein 1-like isoform X2 [Ipomoea nil]